MSNANGEPWESGSLQIRGAPEARQMECATSKIPALLGKSNDNDLSPRQGSRLSIVHSFPGLALLSLGHTLSPLRGWDSHGENFV